MYAFMLELKRSVQIIGARIIEVTLQLLKSGRILHN